MARIQLSVEMTNIYSFEAPAYGYGYETRYIYTMMGEDGTVYVWKTASVLYERAETDSDYDYAEMDSKGRKFIYNRINKGDKLVITATVKGQSEYKGQPQTELTRVKVKERTFAAKTWEEIQAERKAAREAKKQEQKDSIGENDYVWKMPYRQYKEHYSDCETIIDSYEKRRGTYATIEVIIREGRLKASGVRGKMFGTFNIEFTDEEGNKDEARFRAVCEENALRQWRKAYPGCRDAKVVGV